MVMSKRAKKNEVLEQFREEVYEECRTDGRLSGYSIGMLDLFFSILQNYELKELSKHDFRILLLEFSYIYTGEYDILGKKEASALKEKDIAELVLLFRNAKNIQIIADTNKGVQKIKIEKESLQKLLEEKLSAFLYDEYVLNQALLEWDLRLEENIREDESVDVIEKSEYTSDESLNRIIKASSEKKPINKSRMLYDLGRFVSGDRDRQPFSKIQTLKCYSLMADFLVYCGFVPFVDLNEWQLNSQKEKYDIVKYWVKSYKNQIEKKWGKL